MEQQDPEGDCPYQFPITFCSPQLGEHYSHRRGEQDFDYFISEDPKDYGEDKMWVVLGEDNGSACVSYCVESRSGLGPHGVLTV